MDADHRQLIIIAQWAADSVLRSDFMSASEREECVQQILQGPLHVREILVAAALDLELRLQAPRE